MSIPASVIHDVINSAYNSMLLETFLCGQYTLLFAYALRLLLQKGKKRISATLALLWVIVMISFSLDWWYHHAAFVVHNDTALDIAGFLQRVSPDIDRPIFIMDNIFSVSSNWLADAILIWRCYVLWEDKKWMLAPLPVLLVADVVIPCVSYFSPFSNNIRLQVILLVSFYAISTAITVIGTSLIILRILVVTVEEPQGSHRSAYLNIQRVAVESGIAYSAAMILAGITFLLQLTQNNPGVIYFAAQASVYCQAALVPLSGIGPTLIAVQVAREASKPPVSSTNTLSRLTFRRSTRRNETFTTDSNPDSLSHMAFENMGYPTQEDHRSQGSKISDVHKDAHQGHDEKSTRHESAENVV
ncbi:hypothetical protein D9619_007585 [Psilocybe cf. subviscida]|uniref:Uncharacterized protein n=1 Tax=Psilocybe cf. subviscida TaxID=2480587 RepID=A0A8H5EWG1_9AGAR|nr:hypothetical protein D9619_007585 [Psilocybe cf. subviscida]